jgi:hypothetical protein
MIPPEETNDEITQNILNSTAITVKIIFLN